MFLFSFRFLFYTLNIIIQDITDYNIIYDINVYVFEKLLYFFCSDNKLQFYENF